MDKLAFKDLGSSFYGAWLIVESLCWFWSQGHPGEGLGRHFAFPVLTSSFFSHSLLQSFRVFLLISLFA